MVTVSRQSLPQIGLRIELCRCMLRLIAEMNFSLVFHSFHTVSRSKLSKAFLKSIKLIKQESSILLTARL